MESTKQTPQHSHASCCSTKLSDHKVKDLVCGMSVDPNHAKHWSERDGKKYYFCNPKCKEKFESDPNKYLSLQNTQAKQPTHAGAELYTCPMHPEIKQQGPGSCPKCGMALEPLSITAEEDSKNPELTDFTKRLKWGALLTTPVFVLAMGDMIPGFANWIHNTISVKNLSLLQFMLATPVVLWVGWPLLFRAWQSLKTKNLNMFTLIGLGTLVAYAFSVVATFFPEIFPSEFRDHHGNVGIYYEAASVIVTLVLLGQVLELKARGQTSLAIKSLLKLAPKMLVL
jgi:Cu+-exporting ATPase